MQTKKSLLAAAALLAAVFASCNKEEPVPTGDPSIRLDTTELSFAKEAGTATVALISNREWKVVNNAKATWVTVTPATGKASSSAQTITIAVDENTGKERIAELTFTTGSATSSIKITQAGSVAKGDGSKENPFNVEEAIAKAKEIGQESPSTEYYYIKGYITSITEVSTSYGNGTFYIGDSKGATSNLFYCFQVKYIGGASFTSADQINVDDEVVMCAQIYNFKGDTPETSGKGASYIYTLNGQGGGEEPKVDPSKAEAKTIQEFINLADADTYYKLTGTITSAVNTQYCSFDMEDATASIKVWTVVDSCITKYATVLKQGYKVTLSGKYQLFGTSTHEVIGVVILGYEIPEHKTITTEKVSDAIAAETGDTVILNNALVVATAKTGYLVTDSQNTEYILVYQGTSSTDTLATIGDKVNVKGVRGEYNSMPQLNTPATTVVSSGTQVTWPTPEDITSTFDSFESTTVKYISYKGKLTVSGNYYDVAVDGASTKSGSLLPSTAAEAYEDLPNVTFKGYYIYTSSSKYVTIIFTEAEASSDPYLMASPTDVSVAATAGTTTINVSSNVSWTATSDNAEFTVSPSSGTGNGTITVTYPENVTESAKTAKITISTASEGVNPVEVNITQSKAGAAEYTWTLKSGELKTAGGTVTSGEVTWTYPAAGYIGFDTTSGRGVQIGKKDSPQTSYTISTDYFASPKVVSSITVNASIASSGDAKLSIAVDGVEVLTNQALTTTATDYTVNNINKSGTVEIKFTATKKAYYLKSVSVGY